MRLVLFLVILLAGLGIAFAYPWAVRTYSGGELRRFTIFEADGGFQPAATIPSPTHLPIAIVVEMTAGSEFAPSSDSAVLTLTASNGGRTVLAKALTFAASFGRPASPQGEETVYRETAGVIDSPSEGFFEFTAGPGDAESPDIRWADLILEGSPREPDPRTRTAGLVVAAIGVVGLIRSIRRGGGTPPNPNSSPSAPRWGRRGGTGR
jgi:hypothetical protein